MTDPTILPRRVLERQARLHQWLQDQRMSDAERTLAAWLINRGDQHLDTWKAYATIAAAGGGCSASTVKRAAARLVERGLLERRAMKGRRGIRGTNHLRLLAPPELLELRVSEAEMKAGADPLHADFDAVPPGEANSTSPEPPPGEANLVPPTGGANLVLPEHGLPEPFASESNLVPPAPSGEAKLVQELSSRDKRDVSTSKGSEAKLTSPEPPPRFAGRRRRRAEGLRPAGDVFGALAVPGEAGG